MPGDQENALKIKIEASGAKAEGYLLRHLSPRTFSAIIKVLPIKAPLVREEDGVEFLTNLDLQADKYSNTVVSGQIVYRPRNGAICIFFHDMVLGERVVPIGRVESLSSLRKISGSSPGLIDVFT